MEAQRLQLVGSRARAPRLQLAGSAVVVPGLSCPMCEYKLVFFQDVLNGMNAPVLDTFQYLASVKPQWGFYFLLNLS